MGLWGRVGLCSGCERLSASWEGSPHHPSSPLPVTICKGPKARVTESLLSTSLVPALFSPPPPSAPSC